MCGHYEGKFGDLKENAPFTVVINSSEPLFVKFLRPLQSKHHFSCNYQKLFAVNVKYPNAMQHIGS